MNGYQNNYRSRRDKVTIVISKMLRFAVILTKCFVDSTKSFFQEEWLILHKVINDTAPCDTDQKALQQESSAL